MQTMNGRIGLPRQRPGAYRVDHRARELRLVVFSTEIRCYAAAGDLTRILRTQSDVAFSGCEKKQWALVFLQYSRRTKPHR
jgi:hypothetical protein